MLWKKREGGNYMLNQKINMRHHQILAIKLMLLNQMKLVKLTVNKMKLKFRSRTSNSRMQLNKFQKPLKLYNRMQWKKFQKQYKLYKRMH